MFEDILANRALQNLESRKQAFVTSKDYVQAQLSASQHQAWTYFYVYKILSYTIAFSVHVESYNTVNKSTNIKIMT